MFRDRHGESALESHCEPVNDDTAPPSGDIRCTRFNAAVVHGS